MAVPRLVLDTNVVLSALLFRAGALSWLRPEWREGRILPLVSRETVAELMRALSYPKFRLARGEQEDLLTEVLPWCRAVRVVEPPAVPDCRDPADRPFLALAVVGEADAVVSGDGGLTDLASVFPIPILDPASLRKRLFSTSPDVRLRRQSPE